MHASSSSDSDTLEAVGQLRLAGAGEGPDADGPLRGDAEHALLDGGAEARGRLRRREPLHDVAALVPELRAGLQPRGAERADAGPELDGVPGAAEVVLPMQHLARRRRGGDGGGAGAGRGEEEEREGAGGGRRGGLAGGGHFPCPEFKMVHAACAEDDLMGDARFLYSSHSVH